MFRCYKSGAPGSWLHLEDARRAMMLWKCICPRVNQSSVAINLIRVTGRGPINPPHYHAALLQGYHLLEIPTIFGYRSLIRLILFFVLYHVVRYALCIVTLEETFYDGF